MDEDDEIQSPPESESPTSPVRSNGRITVTVAASGPTPSSTSQPTSSNALASALPNQQQQPKSNGGGREDCWSEGATSVLIDAWGERYLELSRGNLKQKNWKEVAEIVSSREDYTKTPKTDIQCKNRIDTVKKKFKSEKAKVAAGSGPSKWPFFEKLDNLIGSSAKIVASVGNPTMGNNFPTTQKVPLGIPVGAKPVNQYQQKQQQQFLKNQKVQTRKRVPVDSDSSDGVPSPVSTDSFPPETYDRKRPRMMFQRAETNSNAAVGVDDAIAIGGREKDGGKDEGNAVRELAEAILKFGEAYEQAETSKLQQVVEMEKQRMKFAKEVELQRMQFFMKTQLEISQLKQNGKRGGNASSKNHHLSNNNNSDSCHKDFS